MAKAKKLPSGSWRVNQYVGKDADGKRVYKSFTADSKKEAEFMAAEYVMYYKDLEKPRNMTVGMAIDKYIEIKDHVLSPSTIMGYKQIRRTYFKRIEDVKLGALTNDTIQTEINALSKTVSAKTVKNAYGLLSAALKEYYPALQLNITLPQRKRPDIYIPTEDEMAIIMSAVRDTPMEIPVALAAYLGMRKSEILALKWSKVDFTTKTITIDSAIVKSENGLVTKAPKSSAGQRTIDLPDTVVEILKHHRNDSEYVCTVSEGMIFKNFSSILKQNHIEHFRFHDLRHYHASVLLELGIPDKYAMERMGHATNNILKNVYQHTRTEKQKEVSSALNAYFMQHEMQHEFAGSYGISQPRNGAGFNILAANNALFGKFIVP